MQLHRDGHGGLTLVGNDDEWLAAVQDRVLAEDFSTRQALILVAGLRSDRIVSIAFWRAWQETASAVAEIRELRAREKK